MYPIPLNISFSSSRTIFSGWRTPIACCFPGIVTSSVSFFNFCSISADLSCACFCAIKPSSDCLTSFASWPITGLSSADSLPILLSIAVSSPFLPRYFTLSSSSCLTSTQSPIVFSACSFIFCNCSFIPLFFPRYLLSCIWSRRQAKTMEPNCSTDNTTFHAFFLHRLIIIWLCNMAFYGNSNQSLCLHDRHYNRNPILLQV